MIIKPGFQRIDKKEMKITGTESILLMGDTGCTGFDDESKAVLRNILKKKAHAFIILGDMVRIGRKRDLDEVRDFCNSIAAAPIYAVCGNHDMPAYADYFGCASYALVLEKYVIVALDNAVRAFSDVDLQFLEEQLKKHEGKKFLILFHRPPPTDLHCSCMKNEEWVSLKGVLDKYKEKIECIFAGHIHGYQEYHLDGYRVFITGGGGAKIAYLEKDVLKKHHVLRVDVQSGPLACTAEIVE